MLVFDEYTCLERVFHNEEVLVNLLETACWAVQPSNQAARRAKLQ